MAKFALAPGEQLVERIRVTSAGPRALRVPGELILIDRRVVVTGEQGDPGRKAGAFLGILGGLFDALMTRVAITHQIPRARFASAEVTSKTEIEVRSDGEGYGMIWFEVAVKDPQQWADRLHPWAAGAPAAQPLPTARLVV
jgi:hypothetical protein